MCRPRRPFLLKLVVLLFFVRLAQFQPVTEQNGSEHLGKGGEGTISLFSADAEANEKEDDDNLDECIYLGGEKAPQGHNSRSTNSEQQQEMLKCEMAIRMARGEENGTSGEENRTSGEWAFELGKKPKEKLEEKEKVGDDNELSPQSAAEKEMTTPKKSSEVEWAIEQISQDWREKLDEDRRVKTEKDFQQMEKERKKRMEKDGNVQPEQMSRTEKRKLFGPQFDLAKFRADVEQEKPCDEEPLQVAEYYLFKHSNKMGIYHAGLFVCGIEIHFHHPGIEFWKPMEYSTRFVGGIYRDYRSIYHNGSELYTRKTFREIVAVVKQLDEFFTPSTYNLWTRNCLLFLRTFVRKLTGLINGEQIDWPWAAVHPLKKPNFALKKLKQLVVKKVKNQMKCQRGTNE